MKSAGQNYVSTQRGNRLNRAIWDRLSWHLATLREELKLICNDHLGSIGSLIDYGCGNMPYRPVVEPFVDRYLGADLPGNPMANLTVDHKGKISGVDDRSVEAVLSSQVLEHVVDPIGYLAEANRVLKTSGLLILSTHGVWSYHPDPNDYWRWTSAGLRKIVEESGFEVVRFTGLMSPPTTALQLFQDSTIVALPKIVWPLYCLPFQLMMRFFDFAYPEKLRNRDASVYFLVAKKVDNG